jgi:surface polysaccharide O-acyltransferase-like enzyme
MKMRLQELDYVRALSMLAIIALHVTSTFIFAESSVKLFGMNPAFIINQLARFAVPAFVVLSGLSLRYSKADEPLLSFYSDRLFKSVVPYLIWYSIYYIYNFYFTAGDYSADEFISGLVSGASAPHLYFMVVIIQLYILFPALKWLLSKYMTATLIITFLLSLYFQLGIYIQYLGKDIIPPFLDRYSWVRFPTWIFYFAAGMLISKDHLTGIISWAKKHLPSLFALSLVFALLNAYESKVFLTYELSIKPQLFIYTALVLLVLTGLGAWLKNLKRLNAIVLFLSKRSMTVYFSHILVLYVFRMNGVFQKGISGMLLLLLFVTVISIAASAAIDYIVSAFTRPGKRTRDTA